ncbi:hypothetical protein CDLVIII_5007 [Clostridium sp. DL-VIII]|uniref:hypothetical protein n=1 Tax=Clostridium sp. DL-VIII TaxID=641107 RepID=UPI00023B0633|nr:hypothetical protein [Clostridium sp. DL-VIII]EHJ01498.1 hypothetical protein CDLVIII_5007 [Clostridium sp. DL-VIII]
MKSVSINDYLNDKNPWLLRLIGDNAFFKSKDIQEIEREFNTEKYGYLSSRNPCTLDECREIEYEEILKRKYQYISFKNEIFKTNPLIAKNIYESIIKTQVEKYNSEYYCELGCGYGYNLSLLKGKTYGGEYSKNAVNLAKKFGLEVSEFNLYKLDNYSFIKNNSTILTVDSVMYLSNAEVFIDGLNKNKDKIKYVIQFEPNYSIERHDLIGRLRNKYIELNDYNKNLFSVLQDRNDIEIIEFDIDVVSLNPLLPMSMIVWKFK